MNALEIIGIFTCIAFLTFIVWEGIYLLTDKKYDADTKSLTASFGVIIFLIIMLAIFGAAYRSDERKIDEYKEKLSKYEKLEVDDETSNNI